MHVCKVVNNVTKWYLSADRSIKICVRRKFRVMPADGCMFESLTVIRCHGERMSIRANVCVHVTLLFLRNTKFYLGDENSIEQQCRGCSVMVIGM